MKEEKDINTEINFFSNSKILVQNIISVLGKIENPNLELLKEVLDLLLRITEKQLQITEIVINENYDNVILNETMDKILEGMICVVNSNDSKKIGKIEKIDADSDIYILKILGENKKITVTRDKFNI